MMTITNTPYCVVDDVRAVLGRLDGTDDAFIASLIPQAQQMIDTHLGYSFQAETATRLYNGTAKTRLFTGEILSFTSVIQTIQPGFDSNYQYILVPALSKDITADCHISPANRLPGFQLVRQSGEWFTPGTLNVSVIGTFGYSVIPADCQRACIRLVAHLLKMRDLNYADVIADQGGVTQRFFKKMPDDVMEILCSLKHRNFFSH